MKDEILQTEEEIQLWTDVAATVLGRIIIGRLNTDTSPPTMTLHPKPDGQGGAAEMAAAYADALVAEYRKRT